jgi:hypothetical protein
MIQGFHTGFVVVHDVRRALVMRPRHVTWFYLSHGFLVDVLASEPPGPAVPPVLLAALLCCAPGGVAALALLLSRRRCCPPTSCCAALPVIPEIVFSITGTVDATVVRVIYSIRLLRLLRVARLLKVHRPADAAQLEMRARGCVCMHGAWYHPLPAPALAHSTRAYAHARHAPSPCHRLRTARPCSATR